MKMRQLIIAVTLLVSSCGRQAAQVGESSLAESVSPGGSVYRVRHQASVKSGELEVYNGHGFAVTRQTSIIDTSLFPQDVGSIWDIQAGRSIGFQLTLPDGHSELKLSAVLVGAPEGGAERFAVRVGSNAYAEMQAPGPGERKIVELRDLASQLRAGVNDVSLGLRLGSMGVQSILVDYLMPRAPSEAYEPNDAPHESARIEVGTDYTMLLRAGESDWFGFSALDRSEFAVVMSPEGPAQGEIMVDLLNADFSVNASGASIDGAPVTLLRQLPAGGYRIGVQSRSSATVRYQISVRGRAMAPVTPDQYEPNNDRSSATVVDLSNLIASGGTTLRMSAHEGDEDWLKFRVQDLTPLSFLLKFRDNSCEMDAELYNGAGLITKFASVKPVTPDAKWASIVAPKGDYYVRIFSPVGVGRASCHLPAYYLSALSRDPSEDGGIHVLPGSSASRWMTLPVGDQDRFRIDAATLQDRRIDMPIYFDAVSGVTPTFRLLNDSNQEVGRAVVTLPGTAVLHAALGTGTYWVEAKAAGAATYTLSYPVADDGGPAYAGNTRETARPVDGKRMRRMWVGPGEHDWMRFDVGANLERVVWQIAFGRNLGDLDMELVAADGSVLQTSARRQDTPNVEMLGASLPQGRYYLHVYGSLGASNAYELSDREGNLQEMNDSPGMAYPMNESGTFYTTLSARDTLDYFTFVASRSGRISVLAEASVADAFGVGAASAESMAGIAGAQSIGGRAEFAFDVVSGGRYYIRLGRIAGMEQPQVVKVTTTWLQR